MTKKDPYKTRAYFWQPGEEVFADDKGIARRLFLSICAELQIPRSALKVAIAQFGELSRVVNVPFVLHNGLWKLPSWNYRYQSEADFRTRVHAMVDRCLDGEIAILKKILADEGFVEVKPHQQPRTLEKDLKLLAQYWLGGRSIDDLLDALDQAGYKESDGSLRKALARAHKALGMNRLPKQLTFIQAATDRKKA